MPWTRAVADKLVHAAIGLAAELGLSCVVEGVEMASDIDDLELLVGGVP